MIFYPRLVTEIDQSGFESDKAACSIYVTYYKQEGPCAGHRRSLFLYLYRVLELSSSIQLVGLVLKY